jgi:hypothetical protein
MKKQTTSCSNANDHKQIMKDDNDNPIIVRKSLVDFLANPIAIQQKKPFAIHSCEASKI